MSNYSHSTRILFGDRVGSDCRGRPPGPPLELPLIGEIALMLLGEIDAPACVKTQTDSHLNLGLPQELPESRGRQVDMNVLNTVGELTDWRVGTLARVCP